MIGCADKREMRAIDYKKLIMELLDKVDQRRLKIIYAYIKAILGLG